MPIAKAVKSKDIVYQLGRSKLLLGVRGETPVIDCYGQEDGLWGNIKTDPSFWEIDTEDGVRFVRVVMTKENTYDDWEYLLKSQDKPADRTITHKVFLDVKIGEDDPVRLTFGLYGNTVPKTVENFRCLCTGEKGESKSGKPLHFKDSAFHRIIPSFMCQGGDFTNGDGTGGESIYGEKFEDENFQIKHTDVGLLSMANAGKDTNGSQFFIITTPTPHLDGKHVVFGTILDQTGLDQLMKMDAVGSSSGTPSKPVTIVDCGELALDGTEKDPSAKP
eukprot:scaffold3319_cov427-Prasinococcus_capsulatus_cf.AAC.10